MSERLYLYLWLGSECASDDLLLLLLFPVVFISGWNSCVISLNDNFVFLIRFCQKVILLELLKLFYFATSNYVFYKSLFTFLFCVFPKKIWNLANQLSWQFQCIYKIYLFRLEIHPKPLSGEINKYSFKINMFAYLIMTALLNTVICSKISLVGDSCREEASQLTCQSRLAGFCSMRAATEGYFRIDYSSKILLLSNFIIFYCVSISYISVPSPTSSLFFQGGYFLSFRDTG